MNADATAAARPDAIGADGLVRRFGDVEAVRGIDLRAAVAPAVGTRQCRRAD